MWYLCVSCLSYCIRSVYKYTAISNNVNSAINRKRDSAIAEGPHVSGTLLEVKWMNCLQLDNMKCIVLRYLPLNSTSFHLASAVAAMFLYQLTASSSASWSLVRPPLSCVSGQESTTWPIVCRWPQSQSSDAARYHLCNLALHGPWSAWKHFSSVHCPRLVRLVEARLLDGRVAC